MSEEILYIARRQMRSILDVCEQFGDRSKLQNLPLRTVLRKKVAQFQATFFSVFHRRVITSSYRSALRNGS